MAVRADHEGLPAHFRHEGGPCRLFLALPAEVGEPADLVCLRVRGLSAQLAFPGQQSPDHLARARVVRVSRVQVVDAAGREAQVTVPDYQLSLAIGKEGQNARLAARLTGWRIDIRSDAAPAPAAAPAP